MLNKLLNSTIMVKLKVALSIRIIYWLTIIFQYLLGLIIVGSIAFNVLIFMDKANDLQLHTQFPVKVDFMEVGNLNIDNKDVKIQLVEATSKIHFIDTPKVIANKVAFSMLLVSLAFFYLLRIFKKFITNVKDGLTFNIENIQVLKKLAYGLVVFWLFTVIYMNIFYYYIGTRVEFQNIRISSDTDNYPSILIVALMIWVLAHIFIKGLELQEEKDLTI